MNNQENNKEDLLGRYISPEKIEKAPDGFTSKVMTRIQLEPLPLYTAGSWWKRNLVPLISVAVIILLIVAAYLIPAKQAQIFDSSFLNSIRNIKLSLPEIDLTAIFSLSLPSLVIYVLVGLFVLTLFDRALYGIFKREK